MAQLSFSFGIELGNLPQNKQVNVKVAHRSNITANIRVSESEELDWGDIYEEYEDFGVTSQSWF